MADFATKTGSSGTPVPNTYDSTPSLTDRVPITDKRETSLEDIAVVIANSVFEAGAPATFNTTQSTGALGSELVTNGTFTSDLTGWSGTNWSYSSGTALHTAGSTAALTQNISVTSGASYQVSFTITGRTAGSVAVTIGAVTLSADGAATFTASVAGAGLVAGATGSVALSITPTSNFDGAIDSVSVKAISASTPFLKGLDEVSGTALESRGNAVLNMTAFGANALRINTTGPDNTAFGYQTLYSNTTGGLNSALGKRALYSNTVGIRNSALGANALNLNKGGDYNSAIGVECLYNNTEGDSNSAIGAAALRANTVGGNNSCVGAYALYSNTTGNDNSAFGGLAGAFIFDGSTANATGGTSVFLGAYTKALSNGQSNQIVIGYDATGLGSNSVVLGNDSITLTALKGSVVLGGSSASAKMHVIATTEQLRLAYDGSNYAAMTVSSGGNLTIDPTGTIVLAGSNRATKINDPSGGATTDAEARTAINAIIDALESHGISASS